MVTDAPVEMSGELMQEIHRIWYWNELETILDLVLTKMIFSSDSQKHKQRAS